MKLVLVTGWRAADLERLIDIAHRIEIWESHGREHISTSGEYTFYPPTADRLSALDAIQREFESSLAGVPLHVEGSEITTIPFQTTNRPEASEPLERKPASIAIHCRGLTTQSQVLLRESAGRTYKENGTVAIERLPFAFGVEFCEAGYKKAFAVEQIPKHTTKDDVISYLGDDVIGEDAFRAMR